jgi:hypothetical protein
MDANHSGTFMLHVKFWYLEREESYQKAQSLFLFLLNSKIIEYESKPKK